MKAILLAAGIGKRMGPNAPPKCLLTVGEKTLLQITLESLRALGIREFVVVVGYEGQRVIAESKRYAANSRFVFVENPRYTEGAILSLWTARDHFDGDLLIMDADALCPPAAFERLVQSAHSNCLLVDAKAQESGEEQIVLGQGSRVLHITKRPSLELKSRLTSFGESVGFLKLSREGALVLRQLLEEKVAAGVVEIEHEQVYPQLFERVPVGFETMEGLSWIEIDTPEDLKRAREVIFPKWTAPSCANRLISNWFLPWVLKLPFTPNQWTSFSLLLGLSSLACVARGDYVRGIAGALLFQLFYIVDNWDGDVARAKGLSSRWGAWFDLAVDGVVQVGLPLALASGLLREGAPQWVATAAKIAAAGLALDFLATWWAKLKGFGPAVFGDPARGKAVISDSGLQRFLRANLTHENFSLLVAAVLILDWREPFLWLLAVGSQFFWIQFLWRERRRLLG